MPSAQPALHLHHVRHGVHGPGIAAVQVERPPPGCLGAVVEARFLEPEGVHAEHVAVSRRPGAPVRQHLRHAVAQHGGAAEEEIAEVRELQRQGVARVVVKDRAVALDGGFEIAVEPGARRRDVAALAVVRQPPHRRGGFDARAGKRQGAFLGGRQQHAARRQWPMTNCGSAASASSIVASGLPK